MTPFKVMCLTFGCLIDLHMTTRQKLGGQEFPTHSPCPPSPFPQLAIHVSYLFIYEHLACHLTLHCCPLDIPMNLPKNPKTKLSKLFSCTNHLLPDYQNSIQHHLKKCVSTMALPKVFIQIAIKSFVGSSDTILTHWYQLVPGYLRLMIAAVIYNNNKGPNTLLLLPTAIHTLSLSLSLFLPPSVS